MWRRGIEWISSVDKIAFDIGDGFCDHAVRLASMKLSLQFDERPIGIVEALGQDRSDVNECERIFCKKFLISDMKLGIL